MAGILSDLFGMQYSDDLALLVSGLDQYKKALKETADESRYTGAMQREFETRSKTTANQLQLLKNNLTASAVSMGNIFLPAINTVVGAITPALGTLGDLAERFPIVTKVIGGAIFGLVGLKAAALGGRYALTFLSDGVQIFRTVLINLHSKVLALNASLLWQRAAAIGSAIAIRAKTASLWMAAAASRAYAIGSTLVVGASRAIGTAFRLMGLAIASNPIGLALTAIAVAATLIIANWGKIKPFFDTVWKGISAGIDWVIQKLGKLWGWVEPVVKAVGSIFGGGSSGGSLPTKVNKETALPGMKKLTSPVAVGSKVTMSPATAGGGIVLHYSPTVTINGASAQAKEDFAAMLRKHKDEIWKMIAQYQTNKSRVNW